MFHRITIKFSIMTHLTLLSLHMIKNFDFVKTKITDGWWLDMSAVDMLKATQQRTVPVKCKCRWVHIGATWWIGLNRLCVAVMQPVVKLLLTTCLVFLTEGACTDRTLWTLLYYCFCLGLRPWSDLCNWEREICDSNPCCWSTCSSRLSRWNSLSSRTSETHTTACLACTKRWNRWRHI